jgi:hypothetical protein
MSYRYQATKAPNRRLETSAAKPQITRVNTSLRVRKAKALARTRDRRALAKGKLRPEEVSLAAALGPQFYRAPLRVSHIRTSDDSSCAHED